VAHNRISRKTLALLERRKAIAEKYLSGLIQWEIARDLNLNQGTISRELKALRREWMERKSGAFEQFQAQELARIDALERTYWDACATSRTYPGDLGLPSSPKRSRPTR
jgi:IS30 family transposase